MRQLAQGTARGAVGAFRQTLYSIIKGLDKKGLLEEGWCEALCGPCQTRPCVRADRPYLRVPRVSGLSRPSIPCSQIQAGAPASFGLEYQRQQSIGGRLR